MKRLLPALCALLLLGACGKSQQKIEAPTLAPANPAALGKMVQGVQAAKDASGKDRAISLLEEAVKADAGLWKRTTTWAFYWPTRATWARPSVTSRPRSI